MDIKDQPLPPFDKNWAFFFDIDGTIADIAPTPEAAFVPQTTINDLISLRKKHGVALVSGRSLVSIDSIFHPAQFLAAGQHGLEIRLSDSETVHSGGDRSVMQGVTDKVKAFQVNHPGLLMEYKGLSVAIHYRIRPDLAETVRNFALSLVEGIGGAVVLQHGKMVEEIRLAGGNKGTAIERFMKTAFFTNKVPVFAGDDLTDEDAHKVVNCMGGVSIQIAGTLQSARYFLPNPQALRAWIHTIATQDISTLKMAIL